MTDCMRLLLLALTALSINAQVSVLTGNYDLARTNANVKETILNQSNVNVRQFGKLFSLPVNGFINAQPLYVPGLAIPGKGTRNVVYVVTHNNDVYAFDADTAGPSLWHVNLGPSVPNEDYLVADLEEIGILGTPVIDPATKTIYVVAHAKEAGDYFYRLHALDLTTGAEKFNGPSVITASAPSNNKYDSQNGQVPFIAKWNLQRPGLLLLNKTVYIAFGSHNDTGYFHGWLLGYDASNVQQQVYSFMTSPNGYGASIWQAGRAPAADELGNIYVATGNSPSDGIETLGESVLKLSTGLSLTDWFTPDNWEHLDNVDNDLGSAGPVLTKSGMVIAGGKEGVLYLLNRNNMGHTQPGNTQVVQTFPAIGFGIFNTAFWDRAGGGILYLRGYNDSVKGFRFTNGRFETSPFTQTGFGVGLPFDGMVVSANGDAENSGIFWFAATTEVQFVGPAVLHAFAATDLSRELWNSNMNPTDAVGTLAKFTTPTIANGKVYVPTFSNQLVVYGLRSAQQSIAAVVNIASGQSGPIAAAEMVTIFGAGLGPSQLANFELDSSGKLKSSVAGTRMLFNGIAAPLIYVRSDQVTAIVPAWVADLTKVTIQPEYQGVRLAGSSVSVAATSPGLFTLDGSGVGPGAVLNQDGTINSSTNPAARGSIVVLFGTGQGRSNPIWREAELANAPFPKPVNPVAVTIGGRPAELLYAGAAPFMAALFQVNARVPPDVEPGAAVQVFVKIGDNSSQAGVTIAVE